MAAEKLEIVIQGRDQASAQLKTVGKSVQDLGDHAEKTHSKLGGLASGLGGVMQVAGGMIIANVATAALQGLSTQLGSIVTNALEAEAAQSALNAVIKSTGGIAGVTSKAANDLATSLSQVTKFDEEAILGGENLLLTFTSIGQDIFPQATEAMLNMSEALGQDLKSSAIQLGKALQDPVLGVTALRRVGVNFNDAAKDTIEAMVAMGDVAGAQAFILKELNVEFGNAARAAGTTLTGQLTILKNQFGEVKEAIGMAVLPMLAKLVKGAGAAVEALNVLVTGEWSGEKLANLFGVERASAFVDVLFRVRQALGQVRDTVKRMFSDLGKGNFGGVLDIIVSIFLAGEVKLAGAIAKWAPVLFNWVAENLPRIIEKVAEIVVGLAGEIVNAIPFIWNALGKVAAAMWAYIQTQGPPLADKFRNEWVPAAWKWLQDAIPPLLAKAGELAGSLWAWIQENGPGIAEKFLTEWLPAAIKWLLQAAQEVLPYLQRFAEEVMAWVQTNGPPMIEKAFGEWIPKAIQWLWRAAIDVIPELWGFIGKILAWVVTSGVPAIAGIFVQLGIALVKGIGQGIASMFGWLWEQVTKLAGAIAEGLATMFQTIGQAAANMIPGVAGAIKLIQDFLGLFQSWQAIQEKYGGNYGGTQGGSGEGGTEAHQYGGIARGGLALVGEAGPELVMLPRGATVYPTSETRAILAGAGAGNVNVVINIDSLANDIDVESLAYRVGQEIRRKVGVRR